MFLTKTYSIEDCINYDAMTSNSGKWTIPSACSTAYDSNGCKFGTATSYSQVKLTNKLTSACTVEFTLVDYYTSSSQGIGDHPVVIYQYTNGETTPNQELLIGGEGNYFRACGTAYTRALSKNTVYKIEYGSPTIKVYEGNTQLGSVTNNVHLPTRFEFHMGKTSGRWIKIKDVKVKPL